MFALLKSIWLELDSFLLSKCQSFSEKFRRKANLTNFFLAGMSFDLSLLFCFIALLAALNDLLSLASIFTTAGLIALFILPASQLVLLAFFNSMEITRMRRIESSILDLLAVETTEGKRAQFCLRQVELGVFLIFCTTLLSVLLLLKPYHAYILKYFYLLTAISLTSLVAEYFASCKAILPVKKISVMIFD